LQWCFPSAHSLISSNTSPLAVFVNRRFLSFSGWPFFFMLLCFYFFFSGVANLRLLFVFFIPIDMGLGPAWFTARCACVLLDLTMPILQPASLSPDLLIPACPFHPLSEWVRCRTNSTFTFFSLGFVVLYLYVIMQAAVLFFVSFSYGMPFFGYLVRRFPLFFRILVIQMVSQVLALPFLHQTSAPLIYGSCTPSLSCFPYVRPK